MFKGEIIKGYAILQDFTTAGGGLSKWTFARKNGREYFFKEFLAPKYPTKDAPGSPETKLRKRQACEQFEQHQKSIIRQINEKCSIGGNLVFTVDFFRNESKYYKVTEKVDVASLQIAEIAALPLPTRVLILKTIAHSLNILHKAEVVHGDLKPDNILIKQTKTGSYTAKLIDFDSSYFSSNPPELSEDVVGDMVFYSPELAGYIRQDKKIKAKDLTIKSDIFALGLLFCQYLTGELPYFDTNKYAYPCLAVLAKENLLIKHPHLPAELLHIIQTMLQADYRLRPPVSEVFEQLKNLDLSAYEAKSPENPLKAGLKGGLAIKPDEKEADSNPSSGGLKGKGLNILKK
ncbi:MAG: protein kinase [Microscillaceae bacterium]|jgi:serine/threonine protein kinase|nr:protein kinase [Microscillaceae bacterium]